ncbi:MAG: NTP transferase domain-containing protein, partial [Bdellovibrionales bacterium]|nr:NTP transferase domain-containing protein [Bdellovibrionales bacterium]
KNLNKWGEAIKVIQIRQILMPMAGLGSRISQILSQPKPVVKLDGQPIYRRALDSFPQAQRTVFITLPQIADQMVTTSTEAVVVVQETPPGQALTTELGIDKLDGTQDVIVTACDHTVVLDPARWQNFMTKPDCDAAIFTVKGFPGTVRTPTSFSYVSSDEDLIVRQIGVKKPFTAKPEEEALLVGSFWFKSAQLLQKAIDLVKARNVRVNGELYLDSVFALMIEQGMIVKEIPLEGYINWGDANSLKEAIYWYEIFMGHKMHPRQPYPGYLVKS